MTEGGGRRAGDSRVALTGGFGGEALLDSSLRSELQGRRGGFGWGRAAAGRWMGVAEFVYESRPDAEVMPHVVEVLGVG